MSKTASNREPSKPQSPVVSNPPVEYELDATDSGSSYQESGSEYSSSDYSDLDEDEKDDEDDSSEEIELDTNSDEEEHGVESPMKEQSEMQEASRKNGKKTKRKYDSISTVIEMDTKEDGVDDSNIKPVDEYEYDSSDEEDVRNTVGNIPMNWYEEYPHLGYDIEAKKIMKPIQDSEIDDFLNKIDDPNYWRTVINKLTGEKVVLDDECVDLIQRIQKGHYPTDENIYQPYEDFFTYETMEHPVTSRPEHKRSFIPSLVEREKVGKLVHAIKMGWIKPRAPKEEKPQFYMLWDKDGDVSSKRMQNYLPAPKLKLPGHEESYNPPPEYLLTEEEENTWKEQDPEERKLNFLPKKYSCLRLVPGYSDFIKERFERCLDLYLCPRKRKMRANVDPNDLIPKLPHPRDLQPFPTVQAVVYKGHEDIIRCVTVEPSGEYMASGSDDGTVKVWEVLTGRCLRTFQVNGIVKSLAWCPTEALSLILVAVETKVYLINPAVGDKIVTSNTDLLLQGISINAEQKAVSWQKPSDDEHSTGIRMIINHSKDVTQVVWHNKGDYFASLSPSAHSKAIVIHRLSEGNSQIPFEKLKGTVQRILFHPLRPLFFVATQRYVRMYNLLKQELAKKLLTNCKWVSCLAAHPQGDNMIVGSYDCRLSWFDLELSTKPYKTLRHHKKAIRQVAFHKRYPLFASASDDGSVIVCHGMVYSDLLQNPLLVPVKVLKGHTTMKGLNVLDCCFHPQRPWIFSSGADNTIRLFS